MLVMVQDRPLFPVYGDMLPAYRSLEVYLQVFVTVVPREGYFGRSSYRLLFLHRKVEVQGVGHIAYL